MKRAAVFVLLAALVFLCTGCGEKQVTDGFFTGEKSVFGSVTITGYTGPGGEVVIPARMDGGNVTAIGTGVFQLRDDITRVFFPSTLKQIGSTAFVGCIGLEELVLPDGVKKLGSGCFSHCTGLKTVRIPDGVRRLEDGVFLGCAGLTDVYVPGSVQYISPYAFRNSEMNTRVTLRGEEDSCVYRYAVENNFSFVAGEIPKMPEF